MGKQVSFSKSGSQWTEVVFSLSTDLGNPSSFTRINIQDGTGSVQSVFSLDDIVLVSKTVTAVAGQVVVSALSAGSTIDDRILGTNLAAWLGATHLSSPTFRARAKASGASVYRIPGLMSHREEEGLKQ